MAWVIVDNAGLLYDASEEIFGGSESATYYDSLDNLPGWINDVVYDRELKGYYDGGDEIYHIALHDETE
jgi:hypothetical protein